MTKFARIIAGVVTDVSATPFEHFHESVAKTFEPIPDHVSAGWTLLDGEYLQPEPVVEVTPEDTQ